MKKIYFFTVIVLSIFSLSSFLNGYGAGTGEGATGAPGENGQACSQAGCHTSGNFNPSLDLFLIDDNGQAVTEYLPNETYTVSLKINHTGLPAGYGFQMVSLIDDGNQPVNTFSDLAASISEVIISGRQYVEHNDPIPADSISITWTAPDADSGPVTFYASGNAVNGNFSPGRDGATRGSFNIAEGTTTSTVTVENAKLDLYPNPTYGNIIIPSDVQVESVRITSMDGLQKQFTKNNNVVNIASLSAGIYLMTIRDQQQKVYTQKIQKL